MGTRTLALIGGCALSIFGSACTGDWYVNLVGGCPRDTGCENEANEPVPPEPPPDDASFPVPMGLPDMASPNTNTLNKEKVDLGKALFSDTRLSKDNTVSCETCHLEHLGWADGTRFSFKVGGAINARHTPTLFNIGYEHEWYWDGRAPVLEDQIVATLKGQMLTTPEKLEEVAHLPDYKGWIARAFGKRAWGGAVPNAIAAYLRTLRSGDSRWDKYMAGDTNALSADEAAGWKLFSSKAQCNICHTPPLFANGNFHDLGLERGKLRPDPARGTITGDMRDLYAFRTPTLRSVSRSAPYFHDGSAGTLEEAVRVMASGGLPANVKAEDAPKLNEPEAVDPLFKKVDLTDDEVRQIVQFIYALDPIN